MSANARGWGDMTKAERSQEMKRRQQVALDRKLQLAPKALADKPLSALDKVKALYLELEEEIVCCRGKITQIKLDLGEAEAELHNLESARSRLAGVGGDNE